MWRSTRRKSRRGARRSARRCKSLDAITDDRELSDEVVKLLRARHETRANQLPDSLDPEADDVSAAGIDLTRELIAAERKFIHVLLRDGKITDEITAADRARSRSGGSEPRQPRIPQRRRCESEFLARSSRRSAGTHTPDV